MNVWEALYHSIPLWMPSQHLSFHNESFLCFTSSLQLEAGAAASTASPSPPPFRGVTAQRKWIKGAGGQGLITPLCAETSDGQRLSVGHRLAAREQTEEGGIVMSPRDRPVLGRDHGDGGS